MPLRDLHSKRVLVTGAASGIGRATAIAFARRGAFLVLSDRDSESDALFALRREILAMGAACTAYVVDFASETDMAAFSKHVHANGGPIDVLVNNAGVAFLGSLVDPKKAWDRALGSNVISAVHGLRLFLPQMHDAGGPRRVVNVANVSALMPSAAASAYAASRSPVVGLSQALDIELRLLRSRVTVSTVRPVSVRRAISDTFWGSPGPADTAELAERQAMYESQGTNAQVVADAIVSAVRHGRDNVMVGPRAKTAYRLRRLYGSLICRLNARRRR